MKRKKCLSSGAAGQESMKEDEDDEEEEDFCGNFGGRMFMQRLDMIMVVLGMMAMVVVMLVKLETVICHKH